MATITKEVTGTTSSASVNVYAEWNALQPPNRRCYAKPYKSGGGEITFPEPLDGYASCELVVSATISRSTFKGYGGSGIGLIVGGKLFNSTGSSTIQNATPETSISCGIWGNAGQEVTSLNLPDNTRIEDLRMTGKAKYVYTFEIGDPTVENLSYQGNFWERDITVNWRSQNQTGYEYELYYNNDCIKTGSGNKEKSFIIPGNTFKGTLNASVRVRTYNIGPDNEKYYSNWSEQSISLKDIEARISDLLVTGEFWEDDVTLSWQSTDQQQFKVEVWRDNLLKNTYTGTTEKRYTIPKNTLEKGAYLLKVYVAYANRFVNNQSKNVNLKDILPTIDNLSLSGSNIDYNLILSWSSTNQSKAEIEIHKGGSKQNTINVNKETSYTIMNNTLETGAYTFKVRVAYTSATGDRWSDFKSINATLVESLPSIGALQPDGIIVDKNSDIKCWWTSNNQTKYTLTCGDYSYSGTVEKEHFIPAGTLKVGNHSLTLQVIYVTSQQIQKTESKTTKFIVTGKPTTPTITSNDSFAYNRPVITWDSHEQLGFKCDIYDSANKLVWSSDWQNGLITRIKCMKYLENGTYTAKVAIMNEFGIKSDYASKQFTINVTGGSDILLEVTDVEFGKRLEWNNENDLYRAFYIMRNGEVIAKTTSLYYYDYTCKHGENIYIVRGVTGNDTYKDSNEIITQLILKHSTLATIGNASDCIDVELQRNDYQNDISHSINGSVIYLNGREHPIVIIGEHITEEYSINFVNYYYDKFISMCDRKEVFVYRDRSGRVIFLSITSLSLKEDKFGLLYSSKGLKVDYKEVVDYD